MTVLTLGVWCLTVLTSVSALTLQEGLPNPEKYIFYDRQSGNVGIQAGMACLAVYGCLLTLVTMLALVARHLLAEIAVRYQQAGPDGRAQMEAQYGKANLDELLKNHETNEFIKKNCKRCPNCKLVIQVGRYQVLCPIALPFCITLLNIYPL
ncbi:unnamed protein product [Dibothriocephalus latus]|uniref:Uncharacterized protein n=1 Tax=Dibothriocephalus latus TaxID=60516 RepID=A0A3P7NT15_DIBLA|nr:unnamed protein product [Dibothriocephalus latus]